MLVAFDNEYLDISKLRFIGEVIESETSRTMTGRTFMVMFEYIVDGVALSTALESQEIPCDRLDDKDEIMKPLRDHVAECRARLIELATKHGRIR